MMLLVKITRIHLNLLKLCIAKYCSSLFGHHFISTGRQTNNGSVKWRSRSTNCHAIVLLDCPRFSTEFGKRSFSYLAGLHPQSAMICLLIQGSPPPPIPLSAVSRQSSLHSLPVLPCT